MPRYRYRASVPPPQQRDQTGISTPRVLKAIGSGLLGGLGGILMDLLTVRSSRTRKPAGRCEP